MLPLWIDQLRRGQPLTVTEPGMTRFLMSLEEAVDLILFAIEHGENGDILVQKAPACTIETLSRAVRALLAPEALIREAVESWELPRAGVCQYESQLEEGDRAFFRKLVDDLAERVPDLRSNFCSSLGRIEAEHLLDPRYLFQSEQQGNEP